MTDPATGERAWQVTDYNADGTLFNRAIVSTDIVKAPPPRENPPAYVGLLAGLVGGLLLGIAHEAL